MAKKSTFTYETGDGVEITLLKQSKAANVGFARKTRNLSDEEKTWRLLEKAADEENLALIDELETDEFIKLTEAWAKDSGIDLGESTAS